MADPIYFLYSLSKDSLYKVFHIWFIFHALYNIFLKINTSFQSSLFYSIRKIFSNLFFRNLNIFRHLRFKQSSAVLDVFERLIVFCIQALNRMSWRAAIQDESLA